MALWSKRHLYTEENVKAFAPSSGGVYRLFYKNAGDTVVFYIGLSDNLKNSLLGHLALGRDNGDIKRYLQCYNCFFRFIKSSGSDRERIQQREIIRYSPPCNNQ